MVVVKMKKSKGGSGISKRRIYKPKKIKRTSVLVVNKTNPISTKKIPKLKVTTGSLWKGEDWEIAIRKSLENVECGIEPIYKKKYPSRLLDDEVILIGYQIYGYGNRRKYHTRIPKQFNDFVKELLEENK